MALTWSCWAYKNCYCLGVAWSTPQVQTNMWLGSDLTQRFSWIYFRPWPTLSHFHIKPFFFKIETKGRIKRSFPCPEAVLESSYSSVIYTDRDSSEFVFISSGFNLKSMLNLKSYLIFFC